jgi:enterochelin esterase-like enzyme
MTVSGKSRRLFLGACLGVAVVAVAGAVGVELIDHDVLPGKSELDAVDGACDLPPAGLDAYAVPGPEVSGTFHSSARNRSVGYTIGYPPGHGPGDILPLAVMLHGEGNDHVNALAGLTPAQAVALRASGKPLAPMALVTVDGGTGYWHAHAGDDPMRMLVDELIPMCRRRGLGRSPGQIGVMGISMGGYGALLLAEKHPDLVTAVAAISPAIWTSYAQARAVNAQAYASAADFAACDVITHARALAKTPVRVASGYDDPFYPGVQALAKALPNGTVASFGKGCHDGAFFAEQEPPSLAFLASHIAAT